MTAFASGSPAHEARALSLNLQHAQDYGGQIAKDIKRIYIIACGAGHQLGLSQQYYSKIISKNVTLEVVAAGEFIHRPMPDIGNDTLVILASKSGETPETIKVAEMLEHHERTMAITQKGASSLAALGRETFVLDKDDDATLSIAMLMLVVVGSVWAAQDNWGLMSKLVQSLYNPPEACDAAARFEAERAGKEAHACRDDELMYFVAGGPQEMTAFVVGICNITENLKIHVNVSQASTFLHGAVEVADKVDVPWVLLLGEDHDRPLMEAVKTFAQKHIQRLMIYDSRDYEAKGISEEIRPLVAPLLLRAGAKSFAHALAKEKGITMGERTFMGTVNNLTGEDLGN